MANGLGTLVSDDAMRALAPFLTQSTALKNRFINIEAFVEKLEGAIAQDPVIDTPGLASMAAQGIPFGSKRTAGQQSAACLADLDKKPDFLRERVRNGKHLNY